MQRNITRTALVVLLSLTSLGQQKPAAKPAAASTTSSSGVLPSEETVNAFMRQMFGYEPEVSWKVSSIKPSEAEGLAEINVVFQGPQGPQPAKFYVTADGKHAVAGDLMPFGAHPFAPALKDLQKGINGPSRGPADAPVTIVEFSDLQCPHCKDEQPNLDKLLADNKNVRLVFQNFPLPLHDWAMKAASYADCIGRSSNDAFWKFIEGAYTAQKDITAANADEKLGAIADASGVKGSDIAVCAAKPDTTTRVEHSLALGKALGVTGTPTLFINGRRVGGAPPDVLKSLTDFAAKAE